MYQLTLYFIPSPFGIDWSSPKNLAISGIKNHLTFKDRNIGHAWIEVQREDNNGTRHFFTGMSGVRMQTLKLLFTQGYGLGVLFNNFQGKLEKSEEIIKELKKKAQYHRVNFVTFKINKSTCLRVEQYFNEFVTNKYSKDYGLPNRPRFGEGSGCSAFAVSFLEIAGLLKNEFIKNWSSTISIPSEIMGGPSNNNKKVSLLQLIFSGNNKTWADGKTPHKDIHFWDPDKMYNWVENKIKESNNNNDFTIENINGIQGLCYNEIALSTPQEPIWLNNLKVEKCGTTFEGSSEKEIFN